MRPILIVIDDNDDVEEDDVVEIFHIFFHGDLILSRDLQSHSQKTLIVLIFLGYAHECPIICVLKEKLQFGPSIQPACLPLNGKHDHYLEYAITVGWGKKKEKASK